MNVWDNIVDNWAVITLDFYSYERARDFQVDAHRAGLVAPLSPGRQLKGETVVWHVTLIRGGRPPRLKALDWFEGVEEKWDKRVKPVSREAGEEVRG